MATSTSDTPGGQASTSVSPVTLLAPSSHVLIDRLNSSRHGIDGVPLPLFVGQYERPAYQDFVCGLGAAIFETTITFPLNKLIFRQQLLGITASQSIAQLRQEGLRFMYRGLLFPLMQKGASRSLMFGMYDEYRRFLGCRYMGRRGESELAQRRHTFTRCHATAAFLAGVTEAVGLTPFERVQVLMQNAKYHTFKNSYDALKRGLRPYGIREYYRGLSTIIIRNGASNVLFFALRNPVKGLILGDRSAIKEFSAHHHLFADFVSGAVMGSCISTIFYPFNVIKARMQSRLGGPFETPWTVFKKILRERDFSIRHVYRGLSLNILRSLLTWGLTNAGYELLQRHIFGKGVLLAK